MRRHDDKVEKIEVDITVDSVLTHPYLLWKPITPYIL